MEEEVEEVLSKVAGVILEGEGEEVVVAEVVVVGIGGRREMQQVIKEV